MYRSYDGLCGAAAKMCEEEPICCLLYTSIHTVIPFFSLYEKDVYVLIPVCSRLDLEVLSLIHISMCIRDRLKAILQRDTVKMAVVISEGHL